MITKEEFKLLKKGDRVLTSASGLATVYEDVNNNSMAILSCDKKRWSCPMFYQSEIKKVIK